MAAPVSFRRWLAALVECWWAANLRFTVLGLLVQVTQELLHLRMETFVVTEINKDQGRQVIWRCWHSAIRLSNDRNKLLCRFQSFKELRRNQAGFDANSSRAPVCFGNISGSAHTIQHPPLGLMFP